MISYRYGNAFLQLARTVELSLSQKKDPTNTDTMMTRYELRMKGFLATSEGLFPGSGETAITATTLNRLKAILETPRLPMEYRIADVTILSVPAGQIDAALGPDPLPCRITEVTTGTFMVECGCIVHVIDCQNTCAGARDPVVSLRWTQTESFDQNWYSRLVTDGRLIVRSDLLQSADNFRYLATPPLLADYIRTTSKYTLSHNGLELAFHYEDQEVDRLPPFPATKATGTYAVQVQRPGFKRLGSVDITLEGQKGTSRKTLMIRACQMAYSKLQADKFLNSTAPVIWGDFKEDLFEPKVNVKMTAMMTNVAKGGVYRENKQTLAGRVLVPRTDADLITRLNATFNLGLTGLAAQIARQLNSGGGSFSNAAGINAAVNAIANLKANMAAVGAAGGGVAAPVALGGGAADEGDGFTSLVMPSVGMNTIGLASGQPGIAPPDRKRLSGLLTAMFRDPCLCLETEVELRANTALPTVTRNTEMVSTVPLAVTPSPTASATPTAPVSSPSVIEIGELAAESGADMGLLRDSAPYDTYQIETTTKMDSGNVQMPATGVGTNGHISAIVKSHGGMMQVTTSWVAGRTGKPPQLPSYESPDPNVVPLSGSVVASAAEYNPDGTSMTYMVAGYYVHAILDPTKHQIAPAVAPMMGDEVREAAAQGASFWSDTVLWQVVDGVAGGLALTTNAEPFVTDGVNTSTQPTTPAGFDLSVFSGDQLLNIIKTGSPDGTPPDNNYFYNPPILP